MKLGRRHARRRFGLMGEPEVLAYRGFATGRRMWLGGRVLEETGILHLDHRRSAWRTFRDTLRRFRSHELPGARVRVRIGADTFTALADNEGYFTLDVSLRRRLSPGWHPVELELEDSFAGKSDHLSSAQVFVAEDDADFAVISDIDDTVVKTGATRLFQMLGTVLFKEPHVRHPFPGVAEFYRSLQAGPSGVSHNPIFYVSRSPWNLYDMIERLLDVHHVPLGPLFLRDFSLLESRSARLGKDEHKLTWIRTLFDRYESLSFVLIGDSGQEDPEIYVQTAREYPGRVRAIYIRDVSSGRRDRDVHLMAEEIGREGVAMYLVRDTEEAVLYARRQGLVADAAIERVEHEKEVEEAEERESHWL